MGHRVQFGTLRLGRAPPCWPPKQSMLVLRHYQPAPPTHAPAPPPARDAEAPGRWGQGSVDLAGAGDSRCLGETLDSEGRSEKRPGLLPAPGTAPGRQDPQTPEPPGGCLLGCTSPQSSQLQPDFSGGKMEAQRGGGPEHSCPAPEASLGPNPPVPPLCPCQELQLELSWESAGRGKEAALWAEGALGVAPASSLPSP